MKYAEVAVDAPTGHARTFSYSIPASLTLEPGQLVSVPFGSRRLQGVVFSLENEPAVSHTRDVASAVSVEPYLSAVHLDLARWVADHYACSLFEAAAPMLPPGARTGSRLRVDVAPGLTDDLTHGLTRHQARVMEYLRAHAPVSRDRVLRALGEGTDRTLRALERKNLIVVSAARQTPSVGPKVVRYLGLTPLGRSETAEIPLASLARAPKQAELAELLAVGDGMLTLSEAKKTFGESAVGGLRRRGWATVVLAAEARDPLAGLSVPPAEPVDLTPAQAAAATEVGRALLGDGDGRTFLLEGVTGSGKTEVYLDAVQACIAAGKRAIVLVPEIALTHQTIERLAGRFPGAVAVQHSGLSQGERYDQWWKIRQGEYGVVVGSRSAVFAPQPDLGLIVLDEEHEWTYKQNEPDPRYHAREVALRLAEMTGAVVLMGSATPDVVTFHDAESGRHHLLRLRDRVAADGGGRVTAVPLAQVEVVDMRRELKEGHRHFLSRPLLSSLEGLMERGGKAILFLNRRGASQMTCRSCGYGVRCRRCDVPMTYHRDVAPGGGRLLCHYCGNRRRPPAVCPDCRESSLELHGLGTQSVEAEVADLFPAAQVLRWDRDTGRSASAVKDIMDRFRDDGPAVLVGTQLVAKGLHFPRVTLVGVILADLGLGVPDFRAGERTFQILSQVAGRAGRGREPGRVIVQTYRPDNYAILAAAVQDFPAFFEQELEYRREMGNPPFSRLIRLGYSHTNAAAAEREALRYADLLRHERDVRGIAGLHVMGPTPGFPPRLKGRFRWQVTLRGRDPRSLLNLVPVPPKWTVDVDPVGP